MGREPCGRMGRGKTQAAEAKIGGFVADQRSRTGEPLEGVGLLKWWAKHGEAKTGEDYGTPLAAGEDEPRLCIGWIGRPQSVERLGGVVGSVQRRSAILLTKHSENQHNISTATGEQCIVELRLV